MRAALLSLVALLVACAPAEKPVAGPHGPDMVVSGPDQFGVVCYRFEAGYRYPTCVKVTP